MYSWQVRHTSIHHPMSHNNVPRRPRTWCTSSTSRCPHTSHLVWLDNIARFRYAYLLAVSRFCCARSSERRLARADFGRRVQHAFGQGFVRRRGEDRLIRPVTLRLSDVPTLILHPRDSTLPQRDVPANLEVLAPAFPVPPVGRDAHQVPTPPSGPRLHQKGEQVVSLHVRH